MISNHAAANLDLTTRIAIARVDVACGTATPEELLAIIEDLWNGRDEEIRDLRNTADRLHDDLREEAREHELKADSLEESLDTIMRLVRDAADNSAAFRVREDALEQLWQDVNAAAPKRFR